MDITKLARYIINYALRKKKPISYIQLNRIIFLLNGEYFSRTGMFLVDEDFYTHPAGPTTKTIQKIYRAYGAGKIYSGGDVGDLTFDAQIVDEILQKQINLSAFDLLKITRGIGTSYNVTGMYSIIDIDMIKKEFSRCKEK